MKKFLALLFAFSNVCYAGPPVTWSGSHARFMTSGSIIIPALSTGIAHLDSSGLMSSSPVDLSSADVTNNLPYLSLASVQVNKNLFVDGSRTDSYTADGSAQRPFKTITAAINQVAANGDNSTHQYTINVVPGGYAETLSFNSSSLYSLVIQSTQATAPIATQSTTVTGITSTSNNTQLATLIFSNITVNGNLNLTGDETGFTPGTPGSNFCSVQCLFIGTQFNNSSGTITLNNVNNVSFYGGQIQGTGSVATFTNVAFAYMNGPEGFISGTVLHLVDNSSGNVPAQYFGNYFLMSSSKFYGTMTIDAGSELDILQNYFGSTSNITNNGTIHSWSSAWGNTTSAVFNSGSVYRNRGDTVWVPHTFNAGSTVQNQDWVYMVGGVFGTSAVPGTNTAIVTKDGHYKSTQTTPPSTTLSGNAGSGGSPSCTVANATDTAGTITLVTGTSAWVAGTQCTVNFNKSYGVAPICTLSEANAQASASKVSQQVNAPDAATGNFTVNFGVADTAQHTFKWKYHCVETQ